MLFQTFLSLLIFIIIIRLTMQFLEKNISLFFFLLFLSVWLLVLFFNWNNSILNRIGLLLGLARGADAIVYTALVILFYFIFVCMIRFYKIKQDIDKLIKKDAKDDFFK